MLLAANIAKTHLFAQKKQTLIASLGVTFGIAMFILMISVMTGVNKLLEDTSLASTPHVRLYKEIKTDPQQADLLSKEAKDKDWHILHHPKPKETLLNIKDAQGLIAHLQADSRISGISGQANSQVFYNYGPVQLSGIVSGVDILKEDQLYQIGSKMKSGSLTALLSGSDGLIMGKGLAQKLNVRVGDKVNLTTPKGGQLSLRIVGIFQMGIGAIDNIKSYTSLSTVRKILQEDGHYLTDIHIKLHDLYTAKEMAKILERPEQYVVEDWETANATIMTSFAIRNTMTAIVVATLLIVAGFGIYNIMNITVHNKMKDIAILKATGFQSKEVVQIFLFQAVFIGIIGAFAGLLIGFGLSYAVSQIPFDGGEFLSTDKFPVNMSPNFYVFGFLFGVLTTMLAGYLPSRKAAKIDPVAILRG